MVVRLPSASCDQAFITNGFKSWKKMNEYSTNYSKSFGHKESLTKYAGLKSAIKHGNVISKIDSNHSKVVKENREYIKCLLETLLYCAYQGYQSKDIGKMKILKTWEIF